MRIQTEFPLLWLSRSSRVDGVFPLLSGSVSGASSSPSLIIIYLPTTPPTTTATTHRTFLWNGAPAARGPSFRFTLHQGTTDSQLGALTLKTQHAPCVSGRA